MSGVTYFNDFGTTDRVARVLTELGDRAYTLVEPMAEITADMFRIERTIFSSGGRRGGGSWKSLAESTVKRRKGDARILRDTDTLYNSLTEGGAPFQILDINNGGILFGTDRTWAEVHQYGSISAGVPARPFLRFLPNDIDRWTGMIVRHLMRTVKT
jgi:phage gpG-like protein